LQILFDEEGEEIPLAHAQPEREQKWKCAATRNQTNAELDWRQSTAPVDSPAFSDLRINSSSQITENCYHFEFFAIFLIMKFLK
jgi:hypothetical protein